MISINLNDEYINLKCEGGSLRARILSDDLIDYELEGLEEDFKEKFREDIGDNSLLLIESLSVEEEFRGSGLGGDLFDKLFEFAKEQKLKCVYLNASPILAERGLDLESLTAFYERRGFEAVLNQDTNVLMLKKLN